jgi:prolactin releasing hormone receptor
LQLTDYWVFGVAMCHVIPTSFGVIVFSSAMNLTMIAIDRYILIVCPLRRKMSVAVAVVTVVAIGVTATCASLPMALYADQVRIDDAALKIDFSYCTENWPTEDGRQLYTVLALIGQFIVPLCAIALLYYRIFDRLRARPNSGNEARRLPTTNAANSGRTTTLSTSAAADAGW